MHRHSDGERISGINYKKEAPNPVKRHLQLMPLIEWVLPITIYHKKVMLSTPILCGNKKEAETQASLKPEQSRLQTTQIHESTSTYTVADLFNFVKRGILRALYSRGMTDGKRWNDKF